LTPLMMTVTVAVVVLKPSETLNVNVSVDD
jgi:hypothetical protein